MSLEDFTPHQQRIIKRYYANIDQIALQRLGEIVGDLYLASGKKQEKLWSAAANHLAKLGIPAERIAHILAQRRPELLASLVKELFGQG